MVDITNVSWFSSENELIIESPLEPGTYEYDIFVGAPRADFVLFSVEACSDAGIIFTQDYVSASLHR